MNSTNKMLSRYGVASAGALLVMASTPALAHVGDVGGSGLLSGFLHPLTGPDHMLAMVAAGLLAGSGQRRHAAAYGLGFAGMMLMGFLVAAGGVMLPMVEFGIAASVIVLGLVLASLKLMPVWGAAVMTGVFALFHGAAHGNELPAGMLASTFAIGFMASTVLLLVTGAVARRGLSRVLSVRMNQGMLRGSGLVMAAAGLSFL